MNIGNIVCFCSFCLFCALPIHSENITFDASADLDGDGKEDAIHLSIGSEGEYALEINTVSITGKLPDPGSLCDEAKYRLDIIDIDKTDRYQEVKILQYSGVDSCMDFTHNILWYSGSFIKLMWALEGQSPSFSGYGIVLVSEWISFWLKTDKYVLDPKTRTMVFVPQAFYYVGVEATVDQSIPIFRTTACKDVVANLRKGSTCSILLYDQTSGCYLIKSTTGLVGWTGEVYELALPSAG